MDEDDITSGVAPKKKKHSGKKIGSEEGINGDAGGALTVKDHGLVLLLCRTPVGVSPEDVPPLAAVEVENLVDEDVERLRVSQRVRPLQCLRRSTGNQGEREKKKKM